jgi:hypothetical protein
MNKKRIGVLAVSMLAIGSFGSIAMQTFAQTPPPTATVPTTVTVKADQTVDQKDSTGADIETQDDAATSVSSTGSAIKSEKGEVETNDTPDSQENEAD